MQFTRDVESNSVSLRLRKPYTNAELSAHTVLTDDVFSYIDFYFKTHKRIVKKANGKKVEQNHSFYWEQAKNFYYAAKILPIESAPLPAYYCMLNAMKAFLIYKTTLFDAIENDFKGHGLKEYTSGGDMATISLSDISIEHLKWGVFYRFARELMPDFNSIWINDDKGAKSIKELICFLPFVHSAYVSTYKIPRTRECFLPLKSGTTPTFKYQKNGKIRLVAELDPTYFKQDAVTLPEEFKKTLHNSFEINPDNGFEIVSKKELRKKEIRECYNEYRKCFSYISSGNRIWYLNRYFDDTSLSNLNTMIIEVAITHRFSEIVRYKPEQMIKLLNSKENWLIHEFLSLVLDQFMDEIACEITKQEIMPTRVK